MGIFTPRKDNNMDIEAALFDLQIFRLKHLEAVRSGLLSQEHVHQRWIYSKED